MVKLSLNRSYDDIPRRDLVFPISNIAKNHYGGDESDELDLLTYHKLILLIAVLVTLVQYYFYQAVAFFN